MNTTRNRLEWIAWWIGAPVLIALLTWGPYWMRAIALGHADWWRIPFVGDAIFDVAAYLQSVGHAALGIPAGTLAGPFAHVARAIALAFPSASIAEIWLDTRWITTVLGLWTGAWAMRRWSGLPIRSSRFISAAFWVSLILVLGMKPGMFSWFLPEAFVALGAMPLVAAALERRRWIRAIAWSLLIVVMSSVYAWYLIFVAVWLAVVWFRWFALQSLRLAAFWYAAGAVVACAASIAAARWITSTPQGMIAFQIYERSPLSFSRMPFVSGSVLLTALWIVLLIPVARRAVGKAGRLAEGAAIAWIALLLCFLHSPFVGFYIMNDHFRSAAAICSWLTLAMVWNLTRSAEVRPRAPSAITRWAMYAVLAISGLYTLHILIAPYAWNHDLLNVLHLTHWFAVTFAAVLVMRWIQGKRPMNPMPFAIVLGIGALVIGGVAWTAALTFEFQTMDRIGQLAPLFSWVETNVPTEQSLCSDHGGDGFSLGDQLSAITGRVVYFAHTTQYHNETDRAYLDHMRTVAPFYDVRGATDDDFWQLMSSENQFIVCAQFPWQSRILRKLGMTQDQINALIGCPQQLIDARWAYVKDAIDHPVPNADAFRAMCPYVVIPDRTKAYWNLPSGYKETRVMDGVSVWSMK